MDSDSSETNLVIVTKKYRLILFCKLYWRSLVILVTPIVLMPIAFIGQNHAYPSFYVFLVSSVYWTTDVLHPGVISLVPLAWYSIIGTVETGLISQVYLRNGLLDCLGIMMLVTAVERSKVHRRVAIKLLLLIGCSHYRLSLVLFFSSMFLSMWMSNAVACGLMMPLVKALLQTLEKMGILEMYQTVGKGELKSRRHEMSDPKPTEFTVFYFLGIAYSCSIGGMATLLGSQTNKIFKAYCESMFPQGPKIEFPQFTLLSLPGVLVMESLLYIWMNSYFMKVFRTHEIAMQSGLTEEEARYTHTLLRNQYRQLGNVTFHDIVVGSAVLLTIALQVMTSATRFDHGTGVKSINTHVQVSTPLIICVLLLFAAPTNLDFLKFLQRSHDAINNPLPTSTSKACLSWNVMRQNMLWSTLFTIGGTCMTFEALKQSGMSAELGRFLRLFSAWPPAAIALVVILFCKVFTEFAGNSCVVDALLPEIARLVGGTCMTFEALKQSGMSAELGRFLRLFSAWPPAAIALVVILFCKVFTEFAGNSCVVDALLPEIARLSVMSEVHPHYLMLAATLASSLPCHLVTGTPANAMVSQYVHIPPWTMLAAGVGPSVIAAVVPWFTVTIWSKAVWADASSYPPWAREYNFE